METSATTTATTTTIVPTYIEVNVFSCDGLEQFQCLPLSWFSTQQDDKLVPLKGLNVSLVTNQADQHEPVTVRIGNQSFTCSFALLKEHSKYFAEQLQSTTVVTLSSDSISADIFQNILEWSSMQELQQQRAKMLELLLAARYLGIEKLTYSIWDCLTNAQCYSEVNAFECFLEARRRNMNLVAQLMLRRIGKCFLTLVGTQEFSELSKEDLMLLLSSQNIAVQSEMEVLFAVMLWIYQKPALRLGSLHQILTVVRFELMSVRFLFEMHTLRLLNYVPHSIMRKRIQTSVWLAKREVEQASPLCLAEQIIPVGDRVWIKDADCPYKILLVQHKHLTIQNFVDYIKILQTKPVEHWQNMRTM